MAKAFIKNGNFNNAVRLLEIMGNLGCTPDDFTYSILLSSCDNKESDQIVNSIMKRKEAPNLVLSTVIIQSFLRSGQLHRAREFFYQMINNNLNLDENIYSSYYLDVQMKDHQL